MSEPTIFDEEFFRATCPKCGGAFVLTPELLKMRGCESGGIYLLEIICPTCNHAADMMGDR